MTLSARHDKDLKKKYWFDGKGMLEGDMKTHHVSKREKLLAKCNNPNYLRLRKGA